MQYFKLSVLYKVIKYYYVYLSAKKSRGHFPERMLHGYFVSGKLSISPESTDM